MAAVRARNRGELAAAGVVVALGAIMVIEGRSYDLGDIGRIGPGFFPIALGVLLIAMGVGLVLEVRRLAVPAPPVHWRAMALVMLALAAFAVTVRTLGLVPATVLLVGIAGLADRTFRPRPMALTAAALSAVGYGLFVKAFAVPLPAIRWPF